MGVAADGIALGVVDGGGKLRAETAEGHARAIAVAEHGQLIVGHLADEGGEAHTARQHVLPAAARRRGLRCRRRRAGQRGHVGLMQPESHRCGTLHRRGGTIQQRQLSGVAVLHGQAALQLLHHNPLLDHELRRFHRVA